MGGGFDFDNLTLDDDDVPSDELPPIEPSSSPTHRVVRFKISNADAERLSDYIEKVGKANGFTKSDALTNAGDALVEIMKGVW